ncbi:MAG: glycosyltransferase family 2 protein [Deltaproteobacteria bacterium]|nr:glycosyltransferase family 2 protein [Deltaproteobacteria bacterium]MBI3387070.1 glycosyltransferase family 2 protein [Deltaproteobacteria bacterium]
MAPDEQPRAGKTNPNVSVVIPARDEEQLIASCLRALARQSIGAHALEVIVVAAGTDRTAEIATAAGSSFRRCEVVTLEAGNKNAALRIGCARVSGDIVALIDADTELAPTALAEFVKELERTPHSVFHGALRSRHATWVARYSELHYRLVKDLHFNGNLGGGVIVLPRAALNAMDLGDLFPDRIGAGDDVHLGRQLRRCGWRIAYVATAEGTTGFPQTLRGLVASMLRNRRGVMALLPWPEAALQAANSVLLLGSAGAPLLVASHSFTLALVCLLPLLVHLARGAWRVVTLYRRGLGDYRRDLPAFLALDLLDRGLKLWAFIERVCGRAAPRSFRGERPKVAVA